MDLYCYSFVVMFVDRYETQTLLKDDMGDSVIGLGALFCGKLSPLIMYLRLITEVLHLMRLSLATKVFHYQQLI